jgi:hypothetical protein
MRIMAELEEEYNCPLPVHVREREIDQHILFTTETPDGTIVLAHLSPDSRDPLCILLNKSGSDMVRPIRSAKELPPASSRVRTFFKSILSFGQ